MNINWIFTISVCWTESRVFTLSAILWILFQTALTGKSNYGRWQFNLLIWKTFTQNELCRLENIRPWDRMYDVVDSWYAKFTYIEINNKANELSYTRIYRVSSSKSKYFILERMFNSAI